MELHEESCGSCGAAPAVCPGTPCSNGRGAIEALRWSLEDLDCPLMEPLSPAVRAFYEEQDRVWGAWEADLDRQIAELLWRREHPDEAACRDTARRIGAAGPAAEARDRPAEEAPEENSLPGLLNLCETSLCGDAGDAASGLTWDTRRTVTSQSVADLAGAPPVCFNGGTWMAVDILGRAFVAHILGGDIRLLIFDARNPRRVLQDIRISPPALGNPTTRVGAPCVALSAVGGGTALTVAFLGGRTRRLNALYISRAFLTRSARLSVPQTQQVTEIFGEQLANPAVFHDNRGNMHLVVTSVPSTSSSVGSYIWWACIPWQVTQFVERWSRQALLPTNESELGFPTVAARWIDSRLTLVVACKATNSGLSGVYVNAAEGVFASNLSWTGWTFLAGVDVIGGAATGQGAAEPSAWVNECGRFYIGFQRISGAFPNNFVRPTIASNHRPVAFPSAWAYVDLVQDYRTTVFVRIAGSEEFAFAVWESRRDDPNGQGLLAPTWSGAIGVHSEQGSPRPHWAAVDPTTGWGLNLDDMEPDLLLFPTCYVQGSEFFVAWLYVDRTQIANDALTNLFNWSLYPSAFAQVIFMRGEILCK